MTIQVTRQDHVDRTLEEIGLAMGRAVNEHRQVAVTYSRPYQLIKSFEAVENTEMKFEPGKTLFINIQIADTAEGIIKDKCQFCFGVKGGVLGNENVFYGIIVCDFCTSSLLDVLKGLKKDVAEQILKCIAQDVSDCVALGACHDLAPQEGVCDSCVDRARLAGWIEGKYDARTPPVDPIPMILLCPFCHMQHIDAPEPTTGWTNPPHRSHKCAGCQTIWRPADVPTTGVKEIKTHGERDIM